MTAERTLRAGLAGVAAFAVGYLLPGTLHLPVPLYYPALRAVHLTALPLGISMRYFADFAFAALLAAGAALVASRLAPRRTPIAVATGTALSLVALDVAYYLSRLIASV